MTKVHKHHTKLANRKNKWVKNTNKLKGTEINVNKTENIKHSSKYECFHCCFKTVKIHIHSANHVLKTSVKI